MPVTVCTGHCSEHPEIIVKAAPLGTWYLGTYQLMWEELKRILLPPDLGPSENKEFKSRAWPPPNASVRERHAKRSFCLYS